MVKLNYKHRNICSKVMREKKREGTLLKQNALMKGKKSIKKKDQQEREYEESLSHLHSLSLKQRH